MPNFAYAANLDYFVSDYFVFVSTAPTSSDAIVGLDSLRHS